MDKNRVIIEMEPTVQIISSDFIVIYSSHFCYKFTDGIKVYIPISDLIPTLKNLVSKMTIGENRIEYDDDNVVLWEHLYEENLPNSSYRKNKDDITDNIKIVIIPGDTSTCPACGY